MPVQKFIITALSLAVLFWLESTIPLMTGRTHRVRHAAHNLAVAIINGALVALLISGLMVATINWAELHGVGLLRVVSLHPITKTIIALICFDLWMYSWHKVNHLVPFLWRFHRAHHSDTEMDCTSALRFHPLEIMLSTLARIPVVIILGLDISQLAIYELLLQPVIFFHHSNIALPDRIDSLLSKVIVTPNIHRVHHSQLVDETNSNYSSILSIWDKIFGSFRQVSEPKNIIFGLEYFRSDVYPIN